MRKNGGVLERFLKSLLVAIFAAVVAFAPAHADDACKNLFDEEWLENGAISAGGQEVLSAGWSRSGFIPVTPGATYTWSSRDFTGSLDRYYFLYKDTTTFKSYTHSSPLTATEYTIDIPSDVNYIRLQERAVGATLAGIKNQLERGDTATAYQPYNPLCATCDGTVVNYTTVTENDVPAGVQNGTPSPTNPIEPVFYQQGDMVLRRIGNVADSYDATTGKITRRVGVKVLDGRGFNWSYSAISDSDMARIYVTGTIAVPVLPVANVAICSHAAVSTFSHRAIADYPNTMQIGNITSGTGYIGFKVYTNNFASEAAFRQWLVAQNAAGTPVTVYYPLAEPTEEDWAASYCRHPVKIATTKYSNAKFDPVITSLNTAVATIKDVVSNTITQTAAIAQIASDKQTRPDSACPAGKKCLLIEDANGDPHWYEIIEEYIPPE